jgi:hypothetical protein
MSQVPECDSVNSPATHRRFRRMLSAHMHSAGKRVDNLFPQQRQVGARTGRPMDTMKILRWFSLDRGTSRITEHGDGKRHENQAEGGVNR